MNTQTKEYDAAQALLDLHRGMNQDHLATNMHHQNSIREETEEEREEKSKRLVLSCTIMDFSRSNMSKNLTPTEEEPNEELPTVSKLENVTSYVHKKKRVAGLGTAMNRENLDTTQNFNEKHICTRESSSSKQLDDNFQPCGCKKIKEIKEMPTQTEEPFIVPLETLQAKILSLQDQFNQISLGLHTEPVNSENESDQSTEHNTSESENTTDENSNNKTKKNDNSYLINNDKIKIGDGYTKVSAHTLRNINWNSYTSATRALLKALFKRKTLATHSLTGKRSPAFPNKAPKKRLNPVIVNDIVKEVVERCSVPENIVRTSITTKCADEYKMSRTRLNKRKRKASEKKRENAQQQLEQLLSQYQEMIDTYF